jgi:hypothetical protein
VKSVGQRLTLFALERDQSMRDVVLIQKIVELTSVTCAARSQYTQSSKFAVPRDSTPPHDQGVHDWFADPWYLSQHAPQFSRRQMKDLSFVRCDPRRRERRCALQHCDVANEIALVPDCEFLFDAIPLLDDLYFAAQDNRQTDVPLPGFEEHLTALDDTALS